MSDRTRALPLAVFLFTLVLLVPRHSQAGCLGDGDCKERTVCQDGVCVDILSAPSYAPVHTGFYPPTPPPVPPPPPPRGARSYLAIGGVGDLLASPLGGISVQGQYLFRAFQVGVLDGGPTVNVLNDLSFRRQPGSPVYEGISAGFGFDLGVLRVLQLGPRVGFGYGSDVTSTLAIHGGLISVGGHVLGWLNRVVGLYLDADALFSLGNGGPAGARVAGGLCFSLDPR